MAQLRDYQQTGIEEIFHHFQSGNNNVILFAAPGSGKCLSPDTMVLKSDGSEVRADQIRSGDFLLNEKSIPVKVLSIISGMDIMYKITPNKGSDGFICTQDHILTLRSGNNFLDIRLDEYLKNMKKYIKYKYCYESIDCFAEINTPIDPYTMGVWLGDGSSYHATLYCPDLECVSAFESESNRYKIKPNKFFRNGCYEVQSYSKTNGLSTNEFWRALSENIIFHPDGKNEKTITDKYLKNSRNNRLNLLAGLIDTDGHLSRGCFEICQKHKGMADKISWLARSLGFMVNKSIKNVKDVDYYRLSISGDTHLIPTRVERKQAPVRRQVKNVLNTGFTVERIGKGNFFGFKVDGGRFLLADFTVTHNSEMGAYLARDCLKNNFPCVFVVRGRELVKNLSNRLSKYKIDHSVFMSGHPRLNKSKLVQVCSIDTLSARSSFPFADQECLIILDEQHKDYTKIYENYKKAFIVGMSGTPFNDKMNQHYHAVVNPIEAYELRDQGFLVPEKHYCPHVMDTSNIKIVAGDFEKKAVESLVTESRVVGDIVTDYIDKAKDRPAVCFCFSVKHSQMLAEAFNKAGIKAIHVDASSPESLKDYAKQGLENGSIKVVCNVDIFSVGWDCPAVSCVILARPTWSLIWYLQAIGRGLRSFSGKNDCIILDSAGNVFRHGTAYEIRSIDLQKKPEKKSFKIRDNIKNCEGCFYIIPFTTVECPACGHIHKQKIKELKAVDGVLAEYIESPSQKMERQIKECYSYYLKLYYVAKSRKLGDEWVFSNIEKKFPKDIMIKALSTKTRLPSRFDKVPGA